jgi:hypothetical protein
MMNYLALYSPQRKRKYMVNADKKKVALPQAAAALRDGHSIDVSYRTLYRLICDGKLKAEQVNGRYSVQIDEAAEALGLTLAA